MSRKMYTIILRNRTRSFNQFWGYVQAISSRIRARLIQTECTVYRENDGLGHPVRPDRPMYIHLLCASTWCRRHTRGLSSTKPMRFKKTVFRVTHSCSRNNRNNDNVAEPEFRVNLF